MNQQEVYNYIKQDMGTLLDPLQRSVMLYEVEQFRQQLLNELNTDVMPFIYAACSTFGTTYKTVDVYSRDPKLVLVRQFIMWGLKVGVVPNTLTLEAIGALFPKASKNGQALNHSNVLHGFQTVKDLLDTDADFRYQVKPLLNSFKWHCEYLPDSKRFHMYRIQPEEMLNDKDAA